MEMLPLNVAILAGPWLLGCLINWGLFGILSLQVYIYYLAFPTDTRLSKCLVYGLYLLEAAQTFMLTHDVINVYAVHFGDFATLNSDQLEWLGIPIFTGVVSCAVQLFYGYRVRVLSGSTVLALVIATISVVQCTAAIVQGVQAVVIGQISTLTTKAFVSEAVWLSGSAACDILIALSMTIILFRRDTGVAATHAVVTKLVRLIVETGCLTALAATIVLVLFLSLPAKPYFTCIGLFLAKLYSNSLLAIFNSRIRIAAARNSTPVMKTDEPSLAFRDQSTTGGQRTTRMTRSAINVEEGRSIPLTSIVDIHTGIEEDSEEQSGKWTESKVSVSTTPSNERKVKI